MNGQHDRAQRSTIAPRGHDATRRELDPDIMHLVRVLDSIRRKQKPTTRERKDG